MVHTLELAHTYKYCPEERLSYFEDQLLRFTQPAALNDPLECLPALTAEQANATAQIIVQHKIDAKLELVASKSRDYRRKYEKDLIKQMQPFLREIRNNPGYLRDHFFRRGNEKMNSQIGILSLSKRWNSTLMWSHYARSHEGFCVGFNRQHEFFTPSSLKTANDNTALHSVLYSEKRVPVPLGKYEKISMEVMHTKSIDWKYEEEERIVGNFKNANKRLDSTPYPIYLFEVPHSAITEIILGVRANQSLEDKIKKFCATRTIALFKATISESNFDVERTPLFT